MSAAAQAKPALTRADFTQGRKFRVIKPGAQLWGWQAILGGQQGWSKKLSVGDVLTCAGTSQSFGDGVPLIKWLDADGKQIAGDCEFKPSVGGMWTSMPNVEYLEAAERA